MTDLQKAAMDYAAQVGEADLEHFEADVKTLLLERLRNRAAMGFIAGGHHVGEEAAAHPTPELDDRYHPLRFAPAYVMYVPSSMLGSDKAEEMIRGWRADWERCGKEPPVLILADHSLKIEPLSQMFKGA